MRRSRRWRPRPPRSDSSAAPERPSLADAVQERLADLALAKAQVSLEVGAVDPGDDVSFLLSLNPGLPAAPLAKAASGGELARTMLALRLIVGARVPTLVFDEVDAGVGGAAARAVGRALAALAETKQVLVVTHLPQVAAFADAQVALTKHDDRRHHRHAGRGARRRATGARAGADAVRASPTATPDRTTPRSSSPPPPRSEGGSACGDEDGAEPAAGVVGCARVGKRTKDLTKRLEPGDIAVIDHADLDRVAADGLIDAGVVAVVNASPSITGRYPNGGPLRLVRAGVLLVDDVGGSIMDAVTDGEPVRLDGGAVLAGDEELGTGHVLGEDEIERRMEEARAGIGTELQRFAENTLEYVRREADLVFAPVELPKLRTSFAGRHALVVVRGHDYKQDLRVLRSYIREFQPVLIGVDGGADALLEVGLTPDIILGDFDSVSARAMDVGAEHVHHVHPDGRNPGFDGAPGLRQALRRVRRRGHQRGRRHAARLRGRGQAHRRRRHPRHHGRVPRQGPRRDVVHLPHPSADRPDARRRQGRRPPLRADRPSTRPRCSSCSPRCW